MPASNNPAVARVVLTVQRDTRKFVNVFHMARSDGGVLGSADLLNMATVVAGWWSNNYRHSCTSLIVGESVVATKLDPADPLQETLYINAPGDGSGADIEPANVTGAISFRTGLAGRKYRGRFYHFMPSGDQITNSDTFTGALLSTFTALGNALLSQAATAALQVIIFHRVDDTFTKVNTTIMDQLVDSMRRRLAGRGA